MGLLGDLFDAAIDYAIDKNDSECIVKTAAYMLFFKPANNITSDDLDLLQSAFNENMTHSELKSYLMKYRDLDADELLSQISFLRLDMTKMKIYFSMSIVYVLLALDNEPILFTRLIALHRMMKKFLFTYDDVMDSYRIAECKFCLNEDPKRNSVLQELVLNSLKTFDETGYDFTIQNINKELSVNNVVNNQSMYINISEKEFKKLYHQLAGEDVEFRKRVSLADNYPNLYKVRNAYAKFSSDENPILVYDSSFFGGGGAGFLFTDKAIYGKVSFEPPFKILIEDLHKIEHKKNIFVHKVFFNSYSIDLEQLSKKSGKGLVDMIKQAINS